MAVPFVSVSDLEQSMGRSLSAREVPKATAAIAYASALVRAVAPAVNALTVVPDGVAIAVTSLAERRFLAANRDGSTSRSVGDTSTSYGPTEAFTEAERLLIGAELGGGNLTVSLAGTDTGLVWW